MISMIVAHDENRVIGSNNEMPWHLPEDLAYFKSVTLHKPVIMGRKTFESIGRPLPNRTNIIITRNKEFEAEGTHVFHSMEDAVEFAKQQGDEQLIIGGAQIFKDYLDMADQLYITEIHETFEGDAYFPEYPEFELQWESDKMTSKAGIDYTYKRYSKKG